MLYTPNLTYDEKVVQEILVELRAARYPLLRLRYVKQNAAVEPILQLAEVSEPDSITRRQSLDMLKHLIVDDLLNIDQLGRYRALITPRDKDE